ncbi:beta-lactamase family protein [Niastella caeni]|uniref:Beta-lactamase family protein n=1 Tax=Niastella caeni TaxID=2569763 RepID=A0A4S8I1K7_9BACT|nr:serine hydrolase domain-containing protein [Niastella caeni]THU39582.1 beta-lactamase family protein [Niastella caeni]
MKHFSAILLTILSAVVYGQSVNDSLTIKLDEYFTALKSLKNFNGNVIVTKNNEFLLDNVYNMQTGNDSLTVSRESKFIMASVSKIFIKVAILRLIDLNKIKITDSLSKYIPDFPDGNKITIEQLLYHKSGLPRELSNHTHYETLSLKKIIEIAKTEKLQFEPGSQYLYSNIGYFILHYIIDVSSKKGYNHFVKTQILDKMNLHNTGEYNYTDRIQYFAYGFDKEDGKIVATSQSSISKFETGNYYSTLEDLHSFSNQIISGKVLKKKTAIKMFEPDSVLIQAGGRSGYRAYFYKNLKTDITFIFLSNYTDIPFQNITEDVIKILNGEPYLVPQKIARKQITLPEITLNKYVGKFELEVDTKQLFTIKLNNGKLLFIDNSGEETEIVPEDEFTFFDDPNSRESYIFSLDTKTNKFNLILLTEGLKLKCKRIE